MLQKARQPGVLFGVLNNVWTEQRRIYPYVHRLTIADKVERNN